MGTLRPFPEHFDAVGPRPKGTKTQRGDTQKRNKLESEYKTVAFCVLSVIIILLQQQCEISQ